MFGLTKGGKLHIIMAHNVIWANQKTDSFVYRRLGAHKMFDITCFPAFFGASNVISSVLLIDSDLPFYIFIILYIILLFVLPKAQKQMDSSPTVNHNYLKQNIIHWIRVVHM